LKLRLYEMLSAGSDLLSLSQMQNAEAMLQLQTDKSVEAMLNTVQKVNASLNDPVLRHLHTIRHNPRYIYLVFKVLLATTQKLILVLRIPDMSIV